ncbi:MAG: pentapeptide repeat-containing protein [Calditrichia bacterium]
MSEKKPPSETDQLREELEVQQAELKKLKEQLQDQKKQLIQQDHRPLTVLKNLVVSHMNEGAKDTREASIMAAGSLVYRKLAQRTRVIIGAGLVGTLIGLGTLYVTWSTLTELKSQNQEFIKQNELVTSQNKLFQQQMVDQQRSTNAQLLSDILAEIEDAEREVKKTIRNLDGYWKPSRQLLYRIHTSARAFETNHQGSYNYERGQLLQALVDARVRFPLRPNPLFRNADLRLADLRNASLSSVDLPYANLQKSRLDNTDLSHSMLSGSDLRIVNFSGANLMHANLSGADLGEAYFYATDLRNVRGLKVEQLSRAATLYLAQISDTMLLNPLRKYWPNLFLHPDSVTDFSPWWKKPQ